MRDYLRAALLALALTVAAARHGHHNYNNGKHHHHHHHEDRTGLSKGRLAHGEARFKSTTNPSFSRSSNIKRVKAVEEGADVAGKVAKDTAGPCWVKDDAADCCPEGTVKIGEADCDDGKSHGAWPRRCSPSLGGKIASLNPFASKKSTKGHHALCSNSNEALEAATAAKEEAERLGDAENAAVRFLVPRPAFHCLVPPPRACSLCLGSSQFRLQHARPTSTFRLPLFTLTLTLPPPPVPRPLSHGRRPTRSAWTR